MGILESKGSIEGWLLVWDDSCDVGQSETEGCSEGWLPGAPLINGDWEGIECGQLVADVASLGIELGRIDGMDDRRPDRLELSLSCDVGQSETEGSSEG